MRTFVAIVVSMLFSCAAMTAPPVAGNDSAGVMPIRGTWLNLFYWDVRDKYLVPQGSKLNTAGPWRTKIQELAEMKMQYLIPLAVVNQGRAYYESESMPHAYEGEESPLTAIMKAADEHGMKVFIGCGWAKGQEGIYHLADPAYMQKALTIMREVARRFGGHRSFYGWYLPDEVGLECHFQDDAIKLYNTLAAEARRLTPKAKILISPYGASWAAIDRTFVEQLAKLDVDIVAYQDSVGSDSGAWPVELRRQFARLRAAHDKVPRIALWAHVESFTWEVGAEREGTIRWLPLVPAAFPRILSQLAAVTPYVDNVLGYAVVGTMDKPGSPVPLGQPLFSARLGQHYLDFLAGRGRWPLLAASFAARLTHDAVGKPVTLASVPGRKHCRGNLTNGHFAVENVDDREWLGFEAGDLIATIDLGQSMPVRTLAARFLQCERQGIRLPSEVIFSLSDDGQKFNTAATVVPERWPNDKQDYWIDMVITGELRQNARYVRVHASNAANWVPGNWLFVDELLVNPRVLGVQ